LKIFNNFDNHARRRAGQDSLLPWARRSAVTITSAIAEGVAIDARCRHAVATGFAAADLAWERCQEQAALTFRAGDAATPSRLWEQALAIAGPHFGRGDPRRAASLTNCALVMRRRRQDYQAKRLFEEALTVWDDSWRWIHLMIPPLAGPSPRRGHSDQLEIYDPATRGAFAALAGRGRAATARLERYDELPAGGLATWLELKPRQMTDLRKLLAAVLLIAPKRA
jgi:hypothetical protein